MPLQLSHIYPISHPEQFKLHLACWNGTENPLDVFIRDRDEWDGWNRWRGTRDDFSRPYIFALIDYYPQAGHWLFGGAYRILKRRAKNHAFSYDVQLLEESEPFVGRLKLTFKRPGRAKAVNLENQYEKLVVDEVLPVPYSGEPFPGFESIDLPFTALESTVRTQRPDWKFALTHAKGIYLVTDTNSGKRYVGSAYGEGGLWSRWECYIGTGHGYTDELTRLLKSNGIEYARQHFKFALLEHFPSKIDDNTVIRREGYWKDVLLTRGRFGYNKN